MTTVQHINLVQNGRRKGTQRNAGDIVDGKELGKGLYLPNGTDLRQVKVLRREEFDRIQDNLYRAERKKQQAINDYKEKQKLKKEAKEAIKNWPNTILGDRQIRLNARRKREEEEERQKKLVDIEEGKYQQEVRRKAIQEARTKQYHQTDRIKAFHSALLLSETLKEREMQIKVKEMMNPPSKQVEERLKMQAEKERKDLEDKEKEQLKWQERKLIQSYQIDQWKERGKAELKEKKDRLKEQERLRKLHDLHEMEVKEVEKVKREQMKVTADNYKHNIKVRNLSKKMEKELLDEEENEIRIFADSKKKLDKMYRERSERLKKEGEERRNKLGDNLIKFQLEIDSKKHGREDFLARDREERERIAEEEKRCKEAEMRKKISKHLKDTIANHEKLSKEEREMNKESLRLRKIADEAAFEEDKMRMAEERRRAAAISKYQLTQVNERAEKERQEKQFEDLADNSMLLGCNDEEKYFMEYADKVIADSKAKGRNVYPLIKAAKSGFGGGKGPVDRSGNRPSYMAANWNGKEMPNLVGKSTQEVKDHHDGGVAGKSKNRLGFSY